MDKNKQTQKRRGPYSLYKLVDSANIPKTSAKRMRKMERYLTEVINVPDSCESDCPHDQNEDDCTNETAGLPEPSEPVELKSDDEEEEEIENTNDEYDEREQYSSNMGVNVEERATAINDASEQTICPGSRLTIASSMLLIITFVLRHKLSGDALSDLLSLIELHCMLPNMFSTSKRMFRTFFQDIKSPIEFHYYCLTCSSYNGKENTTCIVCGKELAQYFIVIPLIPQLIKVIEANVADILSYRTKRTKVNPESMEDIIDGKLYREIFHGEHFVGTSMEDKKKEIHVSLQMNTDGVALFKSSKFSVWPIYMTVNEISPKNRFNRSTRIFTGIWFGNTKANMDIFMEPVVKELKALYDDGISLILTGKQFTVRAVLLSAVFDAPARCCVQNMVQFNGYYGCPTCYAKGTSTKVSEKGSCLTYPFDTNYVCGHPPSRTHEETLVNATKSEASNKPELGVKGKSVLCTLPKFDIIRSVTVDYMHAVLLGVTKSLIHLWIDKSRKHEEFFIGTAKNVHEMNARLMSINPPNAISRLPRKIDELSNWKASEFRSFLLFYSVPVLVTFFFWLMPYQFYSKDL